MSNLLTQKLPSFKAAHPPTPQQAAAIESIATDNSTIVNALAGTGKTSGVIAPASRRLPRDTALAIAFTKTAATELQSKLACSASTFHSLMFGMLKGNPSYASVRVDNRKIWDIFREVRQEFGQLDYDICKEKVEVAHGSLCPFFHTPEAAEEWLSNFMLDEFCDVQVARQPLYIRAVGKMLAISDERCASITFDDMMRLPVVLDLRPRRQYTHIIVDEAQDLSPAKHRCLQHIQQHQPDIIFSAVGDPNQAIFGFSGAYSDSLDRFAQTFETQADLPLTINFRCSRAVIEYARAQTGVPLEAHDQAPEGLVTDSHSLDSELLRTAKGTSTFLLARYNRDLLSGALAAASRGVPVKLRNDMASYLVRDLKKRGANKMRGDLLAKLDLNLTKPKRQRYNDQLRCLEIATNNGQLTDCSAVNRLEFLLANKEEHAPQLMTVHKAKGLEADRTIIFGSSCFSPEEVPQDDNCYYVALTRAKDQLEVVNLPQLT